MLSNREIAKLILAGVAIATLVAMSVIGAQAQNTFTSPGGAQCILRPETIIINRPISNATVWSRADGWLRPYEAVALLSSISHLNESYYRDEAASAAVQVSILLDKSDTLRHTPLTAWLPEAGIPAITLQGAVRMFLFSQNSQQRGQYGFWLRRIVQSRQNDGCN